MMSGPPKYRPKPRKPKPRTKPRKPKPKRKFTVQPLDCLIALHAWYVRNKPGVDQVIKGLQRKKASSKAKHPHFDEIMGGIENCIKRTLEERADEQITPEVQEIDLDDPENVPF